MHTLFCHQHLLEQEREGLSDPDRTRIVGLPDGSSEKQLECASRHKVHVGEHEATWPSDYYSSLHRD